MDLGDVAARLLAELINQLNEQGIVVPSVVYLAPGNEVPFDCEQLTIHLARVLGGFQGTDVPFPQPAPLLINSAEFWATMVRCIPVINEAGEVPDPVDVTASTQVLMRDARAMRRGFEMIDQKHLIVPRNVPTTVGPFVTVGPSGGFAAVTGSYTIQLVDDNMWVPEQPVVLATGNGASA